jgi:Phosphate transporter family
MRRGNRDHGNANEKAASRRLFRVLTSARSGSDAARCPLSTPAEQTECAEAGGEEWKGGGKRSGRSNRTKQSVKLAVDTVGEVKRVGAAVAATTSKSMRPETTRIIGANVDGDHALKRPRRGVEGADEAMISRTATRKKISPPRQGRSKPDRANTSAIDHAVRVVHSVCCLAGAATLIDDIRAELRADGIPTAIRRHDTATVFDWLISALSYQGISDQVAYDYMQRHGRAQWHDIDAKVAAGPTCPKLKNYWHFHGCRYDKISRTCSEPDHINGCPLPSHQLRNGRLNQMAYSLFLFIRDIADGDLVGWIEWQFQDADDPASPHRLARLREALISPLREAIALGLGTMVGWKRIVVTVGEKIGKTHLAYAQGACAEITAAATIAAADVDGLPVSTTHSFLPASPAQWRRTVLDYSSLPCAILPWPGC